jgi:hypothetical protein
MRWRWPRARSRSRAGWQAEGPRETVIMPGSSDTAPPGPCADVPTQPGQAPHSQARPTAHPQPDPHGPGPPLSGQPATQEDHLTGVQRKCQRMTSPP